MTEETQKQTCATITAVERTEASQRLLMHVRAQGGSFSQMTREDSEELTDIVIRHLANLHVVESS
ncbi:hypothetical protein ASE04_29005 [Rhizobium sp. Root708]|nr:hypothetical protein ASE04_29005 [Rhizobium sp. Root708]